MTDQDVIDKAAQIISGNIYGPSAAIETCRLIAQALADAGLLADPRYSKAATSLARDWVKFKAERDKAIADRNMAVGKVDEYRQRLDQARAERDAAVAKLDQVRYMHTIDYGTMTALRGCCPTCNVPAPCPTVRVLNGELQP